MSRALLLDLAARGHRVPIAADLVLHTHPDPEAIRFDGERLGAVIAETARRFATPLALPLMDLRLEKAELLRHFGVPPGEVDRFHFDTLPHEAQRRHVLEAVRSEPPGPAIRAGLDAVRHIATHTDLLPIAMSIGPFSLMTKLLADPIVPVYLAGVGIPPEDDPAVALMFACLELSEAFVLSHIGRAIEAGARAVFIAEPAANQVYVSPIQLDEGSDVFERCVIGPNRRLARRLADHGVELLFHCCGELSDAMLDAFCTLRPALLSLGGSRRLWEDAARVPRDTVLYGNLPSKLFYSDALMSKTRVAGLASVLAAQMRATGHPFILGTECDTLHVADYASSIWSKIDRMLEA